ncbi:MAG: hypothetical protein IGR76_11870 [Synechococcales cyanobacterium T60_A2020_003]|nr:hypothetical protein [Synechococcales cyanobacterium T60_A2020_003]
MGWQLRDYVFAAFMTVGMVLSVFIVGPFVPPPFQLIVWAPIGALFLTLGMARLQKRGSVALMILPMALLLGLQSVSMTVYLALTVLMTELVIVFRGSYRTKANRLLGTLVFFETAIVIGIVALVFIVGGDYARLANQPWIFLGMAIAIGLAATLGWWLGEQVVNQLRRAGKLDADTDANDATPDADV